LQQTYPDDQSAQAFVALKAFEIYILADHDLLLCVPDLQA